MAQSRKCGGLNIVYELLCIVKEHSKKENGETANHKERGQERLEFYGAETR